MKIITYPYRGKSREYGGTLKPGEYVYTSYSNMGPPGVGIYYDVTVFRRYKKKHILDLITLEGASVINISMLQYLRLRVMNYINYYSLKTITQYNL